MSHCQIHNIEWFYDISLDNTITIDKLIYILSSRLIQYDILHEFRELFDKILPYSVLFFGNNIIFIGKDRELICKNIDYNIPTSIAFSRNTNPFIYYNELMNKYGSKVELYDVLFDVNYKLVEPEYNPHYISSKVYNLCNKNDLYKVDKWLDVCMFNHDIDILKGIYKKFNFNILRYSDILYLDDQYIYFYVGSRFLVRCEAERKLYIPFKILQITGLKTYIDIIKSNEGASIELPNSLGRADIVFGDETKADLFLRFAF
jgi:hypothetical protein